MKEKIYVWDPLLRIFHWALVASFTFSYFSGEEETIWHIYSGYTILGLLAFRLVWGFIGGKYARFSSFSFSPAAVFSYLGSLFSKKEAGHYLGHNPAGSWMVIFLLLSLIMAVFSGLKTYGAEGHGPLAATGKIGIVQMDNSMVMAQESEGDEQEANKDEGPIRSVPVVTADAKGHDDHDEHEHENEEEEFWEEIHEFFANLTLLLVLLHIGGVVLSSRKHGENLARAMVTGYKEK